MDFAKLSHGLILLSARFLPHHIKQAYRTGIIPDSVRSDRYGWNCDGNDIVGYYVLTENYLLNYNMKEEVQKVEPR